jgi:BNR repeat-like domain/ell wall binding domain 2 (CWB2)
VYRRLVSAVLVGVLASGFAASTAGADVRVGKNRPLLPSSNPVHQRDAVGLAVNPRDPKHLVAVYTDLTTLHCEVASSFDGGRRWRRTRLKAPAGFVSPACTVGPHLSALLDQSIVFGRGRNVYTTFSSAIVDQAGNPQAKSVMVARSRDGGRTFPTATVAIRGGADLATGPDYTLPKIAVQPGGRRRGDRLYVVASSVEDNPSASADAEDTVVGTSADGGRTWSAPQRVNPAGQSSIEPSQPVVGKGGELLLAWRTRDRGANGQFVAEGRIVVSRSSDRGASWRHSTAAGVRGYTYEGPPQPPFLTVRTFTGSAYPQLAADRRSGNVYLVYGNGTQPTRGGQAVAADHFIHPNLDVYFQRSTDGGGEWSEPARLNREAPIQFEVTQTRHPNLTVAADGRLDVVWQDRRHWYRGCLQTHAPCEEARLGDTYYRYSADGGASFSAERRITDRSMNNDVGSDYRYGVYWAYGPQAVPLGRDRLLVAWMDSRDGNPDTDTLGIYLANVNLKASSRVPVRKVARTSARDLAVKLSRMAWPGGGESVLAGVFASRPWSRVVIVNERDVAGALAGGVLARANVGPVLITPAGGLPADVKAEVTRLAPIGAYLVGGEGSLSRQVADDLAATGIAPDQIVRLAGADAAGTAALVAKAMDRRTAEERQAGGRAFDAAVIVDPASPDAAAASVLAANRRLPVLHASGDSIPPATADALKALAIPQTLVVGDTGDVGDAALAQLPRPQRLAGDGAIGTSRAILGESRRRGLPTNVVFAARSTRRMDAAVVGAAVGRIGGLLMLTEGGASAARRALGEINMRTKVDHLMVVEKPRKRRGR